VRRRFGYRRMHDLLRPEFPGVNHKRVYRLYSEANLAVRKRKKAKRPGERTPLQHRHGKVNEVWSMDFVSDSLANGRRIKCLTVADDFSHECVDIAVDYGISGLRDPPAGPGGGSAATRVPCAPTTARSSPAGPSWPGRRSHGIRHILIEPGGRCRTATSRASTASSATSA
jgi:putative transposase